MPLGGDGHQSAVDELDEARGQLLFTLGNCESRSIMFGIDTEARSLTLCLVGSAQTSLVMVGVTSALARPFDVDPFVAN